jgi:hypothetical protein
VLFYGYSQGKNMRFHAVVIMILLLSFSSYSYALDGWTKDQQNGLWVYTPESLAAEKTFHYRAAPPESLAGRDLHDWFSAKIVAMQNELGEPLEPWSIKAEKNDHLGAANSYRASDGEKFSVGYFGGHLKDDKAYIIQMISSEDFLLMLRYGLAFDTVAADARETLLTAKLSPRAADNPVTGKRLDKEEKINSTPASAQSLSYSELQAQIRTAPGEGVAKDDLETVLIETDINVMLGQLEATTYFLFEDGTAYIDARIPPADFNVVTSKRLEGEEKWGHWRRRDGQYQVKRPLVGEWEDVDGDKAIPGKRREKVNNEFINASGSANFGSHKSSIKLMANGRFELSSSSLMGGSGIIDIGPRVLASGHSDKTGTSSVVTTGGSRIGGGSGSKKNDGAKNTGIYEIDGFTIEMHHDNGLVHRELFMFESESKNRIVIGDTIYWVDRDS